MKLVALTLLMGLSLFSSTAIQAADAVKVEIRRAETQPAEGLTKAKIEGTDRVIYLHKKVELTNKDIAEAKIVDTDTTGPALELTLTDEGHQKIAKVSAEHLDKPLAILFDGKVVTAPTVKAKLGQKLVITGNFTEEEVKKLAEGLRGN